MQMIIEFMDGAKEYVLFGPEPEAYAWDVHSGRLIIKGHRVGDRTEYPLVGIRKYDIHTFSGEYRNGTGPTVVSVGRASCTHGSASKDAETR